MCRPRMVWSTSAPPDLVPRQTRYAQGGMWTTPKACDVKGSTGQDNRNTPDLPHQARMWPTPAASAGSRGSDPVRTNDKAGGLTLRQEVERGPLAQTTPTDGPDGSPKADLNPRFVAALMGVPWDWLTPSTSVATDSYLEWLRQHSLNWPAA